jgi:SAM-dependent methyltransferase
VAIEAFQRAPAEYDAWYDTPLGQAILGEELAAIRPLLEALPRPGIEVGVGSGRFASALGVEVGLDPASNPLHLAKPRGIGVVRGRGEMLPFAAGTFGAALLIVTICFVADPVAALREARRVVRPDGGLIVGFIPADGPWGAHYRVLAQQGDPFYRHAHFFTRAELISLLTRAQLTVTAWRFALGWNPTAEPSATGAPKGDESNAGFAALLARPVGTWSQP